MPMSHIYKHECIKIPNVANMKAHTQNVETILRSKMPMIVFMIENDK